MKTTAALVSALAAMGAVASPTKTEHQPPTKRADTPKVSVSGNAFWGADGKRFYMRGIDYQPGGDGAKNDPLADPKECGRDIKKFTDLGLNTIRVYAVDNSKNHDECMKLLADAGIYLVLDVNTPAFSINRADPHPSYNAKYLQSVFATVEMFSKYDNTLAFFSGNEVINDEKGTDKSAPYVKAVTRDIKNFQRSRGLRHVPVGYSAADTSVNIMAQANYFNCGSDDARSDFFAYNDYSWCNTDFVTSGWDKKVENFSNYGIPVFMSEFGCIKNRPRKFEEFSALMSKNMTGVFSGGLIYEYSIEDNEFGIVKINGDTVKPNNEYPNLKSALSEYPAPTSGDGGAAKTSHGVDCPKSTSGWSVNASMIPAMPEKAEKYLKDGAGKGPGLDVDMSDGSQQAADSGDSASSVASGVPSPSGGSSSDDEEDAAGTLSISRGALTVTGVSIFFSMVGAMLL